MLLHPSDQEAYGRYLRRLKSAKTDEIEAVAAEFFAFGRRVGQCDWLSKNQHNTTGALPRRSAGA